LFGPLKSLRGGVKLHVQNNDAVTVECSEISSSMLQASLDCIAERREHCVEPHVDYVEK